MPDALALKSQDAAPAPPPKNTAAAAAAAAATADLPQHTCDNAGIPAVATAVTAGGKLPKARYDKQSFDYMIRSAVAGGAAGCAAKTLIAPLDRVKILFQASNPQFLKYTGSWTGFLLAAKEIRRTDGVMGLFRGHSATLLRIFPYAAVKFVAYEQIRHVLIRTPSHETSWRRFMSGSLAGVTSVFCTYPLEVIRVRLAFETRAEYRNASLTSIVRRIHAEPHTAYPIIGGVSNFYRGFSPTVLGMLPYAGMSFLTHDLAGDWLRSPKLAKYTIKPNSPTSVGGKKKKPVLKAWAELAAGGFAGMASQTVSYPLEVIRRRMQVGGARGERRFPGIVETAVQIARERGVRGFFVGLSIGYVKVIPMVATSFFVYERMKVLLDIA